MKIRSAVIPLIIVNIVMFVIQLTFPGGRGLENAFTETLLLHRFDLFFAPWTLLTSMFLHGSISHILINMYILLMFGPLLEQRIGPKRFLIMYLGCGLIASVFSQFVYDGALGASGAIMGMIGVIIILMPNLRVLFFFVIPMPLWVAGIVIAAIDLFGALGIGIPGIANLAHLGGMASGLMYGLYLKRRKRKFYQGFDSKTHMADRDIEEYLRSGRI